MTFRAVVFDLFDTLLRGMATGNREKAIALLEGVGVREGEWLRGWRASYASSCRGRVPDMAARVALALRLAGAAPLAPPAMEELVRLLATRVTAELYPDVPETLAALRDRGYSLGLLTNLSSEERAVLERFDLRAMFDAVVVSHELGLAKPEAGMYLCAAEQLGLPPAACVYVDDQPRFVVGAMQVGMCGVRIERPHARDYGGPANGHCDLEIAELRELLAWLPARAAA